MKFKVRLIHDKRIEISILRCTFLINLLLEFQNPNLEELSKVVEGDTFVGPIPDVDL